ncbi:hypothetical protein MSG28_006693 [Choristoneura fumiferana]|uniref:Uncharacterized protein n=1 Tax=Choristoneura fumiferana TaxID=7141 RepID=A0ACC0JKX4_CHOFU|nr:hypothetical protein MSG28_006693 [Choristoneura fumiferana]
MSSTEDYHKPRIVEGQSSSSVERSPEERHQRAKFRRKISDGKGGRRQVTEAEALRAMQRLCARIASQKMLVISSLENDCSKEELNRQIAVLQELQKKYVRLEMALQYSFFDNGTSNGRMTVTPIQETPSLTLSESDMLPEPRSNDPLNDRLKEGDTEVEASDNVSTSNDETAEAWDGVDDPLRRAARAPPDPEPNGNELIIDEPNADTTISAGLMPPIDFSQVVSVPGWVTRGAGASTHHEYEVRIKLGNQRWALLRRYRRFRDLYLAMRRQYGPKVGTIPFPPRQLWQSEAVARARRGALEAFLRRLLAVCAADRRCPLHAAPLTPHALVSFSPFFRRLAAARALCAGALRLAAAAALLLAHCLALALLLAYLCCRRLRRS